MLSPLLWIHKAESLGPKVYGTSAQSGGGDIFKFGSKNVSIYLQPLKN